MLPVGADVPDDKSDQALRDRLTATWIDLAIRLGVLALILYWAFLLLQPFLTIAIWSAVLTVALYPVYAWIAARLGGWRKLAAALLTLLSLAIVLGPATWLTIGLIDSLSVVSERVDWSALALPPPPDAIKSWPLIGEPIHQFWELASSNLQAALAKVAPYLKPWGGTVLQIAAEAGTGIVKFLIAIVVAGFLFVPGPSLVDAVKRLSRRLAADRGGEFVDLAGATIRAISQGVIGVSALQAMLAGIGFLAVGIPGASLLTFAVLILGIVQIGPSILIIPLIVWSWFTMETSTALLFTIYMVPVNLLDNILRPLVMGRGLETPTLVILVGVIGGTIAQGITGLFLGPIVLAVMWELLVAWLNEPDVVQGG